MALNQTRAYIVIVLLLEFRKVQDNVNSKASYFFILLIFFLVSIVFLNCNSPVKSTATKVESTTTYYFRDADYADNRIFDLGLPELSYTDSTGTYFYEQELYPGDSIVKLFIYEQEVDITNKDSSLPASLNVKPNDTGRFKTEDIVPQYGVNKLDYSTEFIYEQHVQKGRYYVVFNPRRRESRALGIYMEVQRPGVGLIAFGNISAPPFNLKLLRHHSPMPTHQTWKLMWRNVYDLRARGLQVGELNLKIFKGLPGLEGDSSNLEYQVLGGVSQNYVEILGLDQYDNLGRKIADGLVDDRSEIWRSDLGFLIFPSRTPFYTDTVFVNDMGDTTQSLLDSIPILYDYLSIIQRHINSQFYLQISTKFPI